MKRFLHVMQAVLIALCLVAGSAAWGDDEYGDTLFTPEELDDLLAPIALYPDPLIAQILPAATFIDQIDEAARYVNQYGKDAPIDSQPWDVSVKAVAHYPDVLFMMDSKYDWTVSLGQAFVNQQQDVMDAIQRLRAEAEAAGNLTSTPQQQVIDEGGIIRIDPAEPEVIYVPVYDPMVVYVESPPYPAYGFITFGIGFTIGAWLNRDCDWHGRRVYYHGWQGRGWISRARPHIRDRNHVYINNSYRVIGVNRRVIQHDTTRFRSEIRRDAEIRRERIGRPLPQGGVQRPRESGAPTGARPHRAPVPGQAAPATRPAAPPPKKAAPAGRQPERDIYRGREPRGGQTVPYSGYGGYGSSRDVKTYQERGQTSRENMRRYNQKPPAVVPRPAPAQRPAPVQRPAASGGRQSAPRPAEQAPRQAPPASRGSGGQQQRR